MSFEDIVSGKCSWTPTGKMMCWGDSDGSSSVSTYEIDDNETDIDFSHNQTTIKWNIDGTDGSSEITDAIKACIDAVGSAYMEIVDQDGTSTTFTANAVEGGTFPASAGSYLFTGVGPTPSLAGKATKVTVSHDVDSTGGIACLEFSCKGGYRWVDTATNVVLTAAQVQTLKECKKEWIDLGILWKFIPPSEGVGARVDYWQAIQQGGNAAPHGNADDIFSNNGATWVHANGAPSHTGVNTSYFGFSTGSAADLAYIGIATNGDTNGTDQLRVSGWFFLPGPVTLTDGNANTGERGIFSVKYCCTGDLTEVSRDDTDSVSADRAAFPPVTIPAGIHYAEMITSDLSAWQGIDLRDNSGNRISSYLGKPRFECIRVLKCMDTEELVDATTMAPVSVEDNDTWCEPECDAPASSSSSDHEHEPTAIPEQDICVDIRIPYVNNPTSWWVGWNVAATADVARYITTPWTEISRRINLTGKEVDMDIDIDFGNHLLYVRRNRTYLWLEFRVLVNGTAVVTRTYDRYVYRDERTEGSGNNVEPLQYEMNPRGEALYHRYGIPVGADIRIETQARLQVTASQSSSYSRYIGGLRSRGKINLYPQDIVVGRL